MRPSIDEWALEICKAVATRAECTRRKVGAIILKDGRIIAAGYNGAPKGARSCLSGACPRGISEQFIEPGSSYDTGPGSCIAIHAEANALLHANRGDLQGSTLYCTDRPCGGCERLIAGSGVVMTVWPGGRSMEPF